MNHYIELLKNPKWKLKSQKILKRDNYKCTVCGSKKYLQIHHTYYFEDYPEPWLYPNDSLITLCNNCHIKWHLQHENEIKKRPVKGKLRRKKRRKQKIKEQKRKILCMAEIQTIRGLKIKERQIK